jgi:putative endonuclease
MFYTYILRTTGNTLYIGYTKDLHKRLEQHRTHKGGAKYFHIFEGFELAYVEIFDNQHDAMSREWQLKQLKHAEKQKLVEENTDRLKNLLNKFE